MLKLTKKIEYGLIALNHMQNHDANKELHSAKEIARKYSLPPEALAKILQVPFAIADATTLTEAGYVGEDVENILLSLIQAADFDIKKAEKERIVKLRSKE